MTNLTNAPLQCPKEHLTTSVHFTFFHLSYQHFTSLYFSIHIYNSPPFTPFPLTFYRLHFPTLVSTYPTLVTKFFINYTIKKIQHFQNNEPLHCPKEPLTISLHFTFIYIFFHLSYQPFTSLYFVIHTYNSLPFTSLSFTVYYLSPSLPLTDFHLFNPRFENTRFTMGSPCRPSRQLVPISNGSIHKEAFPEVSPLFSGSDFPIMIDPT